MRASWFLPLLLCLALAVPCPAGERVTLYLFYSKGCINCLHEEEFLAGLRKRVPELEIRAFEVQFDPGNARLLVQVAKAFGVQARGVPLSFIGPFAPIEGFQNDGTTGRLIELRVRECPARGCEDVVGPLVGSKAPLPDAAGAPRGGDFRLPPRGKPRRPQALTGRFRRRPRKPARPGRFWRCPCSAKRISERCRCSR